MPGFQVYRILIDTRKCFFSVYCASHISLGSTAYGIVSKYKVREQGRNSWSSSPVRVVLTVVLSVVSVLMPSGNREMTKHQILFRVTPARLYSLHSVQICVAMW